MNNTEFSRRLNQIMREKGIKQAELIELTGINKGALSSYLAGRYGAKSDTMYKLAKVLNVSEMWLAGYDVPRERHVPFYNMDSGILTIPFLNQKLSAGAGIDYIPSDCVEVKKLDILSSLVKGFNSCDKSSLMAAEVLGDSMQDANLYSGDVVIFQKGLLRGNGIYVLSVCNEVIVKRLVIDILEKTLTIISENKKYQPKTVNLDNENIIILGKVVGWIHSENV